MKTTLLFVFFAVLTITVYAQVPVPVPTVVHDPTNLAKIKELLDTATKQINSFEEQTKILQEVQEDLRKVNKEITSIRMIKRAVEQQQQCIKFFSNDLANVGGISLNEYSLTTYLNRVEGHRKQILDNCSDIVKVLSNNVLKMNDYERMMLVKEIMDENEEIMAQAFLEKERYEEHNRQLKMLNELKRK